MTEAEPDKVRRPRVAYLTNQYPSISHTFIRREILGLEALGYDVLRLSIRAGNFVDAADRVEQDHTYHCLSQPKWRLFLDACRMLIVHPRATARCKLLMFKFALRNGCSLFRHMAYLVEAGALLRVLRRERIDHVHVHFGTNPAVVALFVFLLGGPTFSMTLHGPDEFDGPLALSLGDKMRHAAFTVAVSSFGASQLRRWVDPSEWEKIHVVHCSVGNTWIEAAAPVQDTSETLVCVGRLSPQKGQVLLVDAFAEAVREGAKGRLVFVGDGELRGAIEARIAKHGLADRILLAGWQDEEAVRAHLLNSRALALASFAEGLPVVIMEAMALKRPVIATYIAGIPELVLPGKTGWLVPAGDTAALAAAMREALTLPTETLRALGEAGAERVHARHLTGTEVGKLDALFRAHAGRS